MPTEHELLQEIVQRQISMERQLKDLMDRLVETETFLVNFRNEAIRALYKHDWQ